LLFRFEPSRLFFETRLFFPPELIWNELDFVKAGNLSPPTGEEGGADDDESMTLKTTGSDGCCCLPEFFRAILVTGWYDDDEREFRDVFLQHRNI
jgi:hypothetical protein